MLSSCIPKKVTLVVSPYLVSCNQWYGPISCLNTDKGNYSGIRDFDFKWGFEQTIVISEKKISNPPEDGSSIQRTFIEVKHEKEDEIGSIYTIENITYENYVFTFENDQYYYFGKEFECDFAANCMGLVEFEEFESRLNVTFEYLGDSNIKLLSWY
ncbi:MAG: DUF4377 domain-containing protein [Saccharospirillaceae bacterium]|nr:DUF4377 domain-containing protein [Saccharospirillaceae bacterium]